MRKIFFYILFFSIKASFSQSRIDSTETLNEVCSIKVFENDTIGKIIEARVEKYKLKEDINEHFKYVTFLSSRGKQYLKIYSSPGNGYGQFFEIGLNRRCKRPKNNLGKLNFYEFYSNRHIKLGLSETEIRQKINLNLYRVFVHKKILYIVLEKGLYLNEDYQSPKVVNFYKFYNGRLISFGFGYGFPLFNPVFPPD